MLPRERPGAKQRRKQRVDGLEIVLQRSSLLRAVRRVEQELLQLCGRDGRGPRQRRQRVCEGAGGGGGVGGSFRRFAAAAALSASSEGLERCPVVRLEAEGDVVGRGREPEGADDAAAALGKI